MSDISVEEEVIVINIEVTLSMTTISMLLIRPAQAAIH
jgi:hypothetical protein